MFAAILLVVVVIVGSIYFAYLIWYVKSGRYDFDCRFDTFTKR
jgi:nitrogen fixation-related uncharacterized protein